MRVCGLFQFFENDFLHRNCYPYIPLTKTSINRVNNIINTELFISDLKLRNTSCVTKSSFRLIGTFMRASHASNFKVEILQFSAISETTNYISFSADSVFFILFFKERLLCGQLIRLVDLTKSVTFCNKNRKLASKTIKLLD